MEIRFVEFTEDNEVSMSTYLNVIVILIQLKRKLLAILMSILSKKLTNMMKIIS